MIDVDYAPAVFFGMICITIFFPALYGLTLVDKFWKEDQSHAGEDVFN